VNAPTSPRVVRRLSRRLVGLSLVHVVDDLYMGAVPALVPFLVEQRHYSYLAAAGVTLSATLLSSVLQPLFGLLADRHDLRWLAGVGVIIAGAGFSAAGLWDNYWISCAAVGISGIGVAAYHPEAARAARAAATGGAAGMSIFSVGGNIGTAIAPVIVAPVLATTGLFGTSMIGLPGVVVGIGFALYCLYSRSERAGRNRSVPEGAHNDWRSFRWLFGVVICRSITYYGLSAFIVLFVTGRFGAGVVVGAAVLTTITAVGAAATVTGGYLADRWGRVKVMRIGYAIGIPGLLITVYSQSVLMAFLGAAIVGVSIFLPFSIHVTLGQEYLPTRVGTASGATLGLSITIGGLATPALGAIADHTGLQAAIGLLLLFPITALGCSLRLHDPRSPQVALLR
jgi:FSR family fosmidomycin resistance protein-like MFS transporter